MGRVNSRPDLWGSTTYVTEVTKKMVSGVHSSKPCTSLEITKFNGNSIWMLAFNDEPSQLPLQSFLVQYNLTNGLTLAIKDIETHEDVSTWTMHALNFEHLAHTSPIQLGSMTFPPTPTVENT